ncbi:hypothetical protein GCM10023158_14300 [Gluconacetobacter tumulicola]
MRRERKMPAGPAAEISRIAILKTAWSGGFACPLAKCAAIVSGIGRPSSIQLMAALSGCFENNV